MLGLEWNTSSSSKFQGLKTLNDYGKNKTLWINNCPDLKQASEILLKGTLSLEKAGKHLHARRASYSRSSQEILVAASDGTFAKDIRLHQSVGLNVLASKGEHRSSIGRRYGSSNRPTHLSDWNMVKVSKSKDSNTHIYISIIQILPFDAYN